MITEKQKELILSGFLYIAEHLAEDDEGNLPNDSSESAINTAKKVIDSFLSKARPDDISEYVNNIPWNSDSPSGVWVNLGNDLCFEFLGYGVGFYDRYQLPESTRHRLSDVACETQKYVDAVIGDDGLLYFE